MFSVEVFDLNLYVEKLNEGYKYNSISNTRMFEFYNKAIPRVKSFYFLYVLSI
jgi:hypothetical protein